ncbi:MAG: esterase-like activity of phytase family protein [Phormidesmis sp.]
MLLRIGGDSGLGAWGLGNWGLGNWGRTLGKILVNGVLAIALLGGVLTSCALPQVSAEERLFLDLSVDLVGSYVLPKQSFEGEPVGGISAIAYDVPRDRLYGLSDNRDRPRFYTFTLAGTLTGLQTEAAQNSPILSIESVTYLKDADGNPYASGQMDPEGMAITPSNTLLISSEGSPRKQIPPAVSEYDIATGQLKQSILVPSRYLPGSDLVDSDLVDSDLVDNALPNSVGEAAPTQTLGVQENLGFEAIAVNVSSGTGGVYEPYRMFIATEGPLLQDLDFAPDIPYKNRVLHYTLDQYQTTLISEHLYEMDLSPTGAVLHGVPEIAVLDKGGHFLAIERSYGFQGFSIKLYQLASGGATDISTVDSMQGDISGINPIQKELLLDLSSLDIPLQNYEAMTFGPTLGNRQRSLFLMSDDNFSSDQETSLLIFRLSNS